MKQSLLLISTFLISTFLYSQDQFERMYRTTGRDQIGIDVEQTSDGGYLLLSISRNTDTEALEKANVTKVDPKGDISWSRDYDFEEELEPSGDLLVLQQDSFAFAVVESGTEMNKIITKATPSGDVVWTNSYGNPDFLPLNLPVVSPVELTFNYDKGFSIFGQQGSNQSSGIYAARTDSLGNLLWAKNYNAVNPLPPSPINYQFNGVHDAQVTQDSGFILCGRTSEFASQSDVFVMKLDSSGNVVWSKSYGEDSVFNAEFGNAIVQTPDLGYAVAGFSLIGDFPPFWDGLLMKLDSLGEVEWINTVDIDSSFNTYSRFTDIVLTDNGDLVVSGFAQENGFEPYPISMKFNLQGEVIWDQGYTNSITSADISGLALTNDGGTTIFNTATDDGDNAISYLIKVDENGGSSCSDTLFYNLVQGDTISTLNVPFTVENLETFLMKEPIVMPYDSFNIPVLSLGVPPVFCEGEPINVTFDATTQGAVSYAWNTGETTPMITVMEEGLYTVEVRIEEDVCFSLCDTVMVSVTGPPTVQIGQDLTPFCVTGSGILGAEIMGAANTIEWSTGEENTPIILIDQTGTYSVVVSNQCGADSASVTINEFPEILPTFTFEDSGLCNGGDATIIADITNATPGTEMWSTNDGTIVSGANTSTIIVSTAGTYTISAENNCGINSGDYVISADEPTVSIIVALDDICEADSAILTYAGTNIDTVEWSTGETISTITVQGIDTYSITAMNSCGSATDEITFDCEFPFDACLMVPNAFTPNNDSSNDAFSAVIPEECQNGISVNRLTIWSRWGEKVFDETGNNPQWDGMDGDKPASADVYIYRIEASSEEENVVREGDVTLIR